MDLTNLLRPKYVWDQRQKLIDTSRQLIRRAHVPTSASDAHIKRLKNCHRGKRAFIIGNGPSLTVDDLDRLQSETTFASNKVYLAFESTAWRPSYYFVVDRLVARNNAEAIRNLPFPKFIADHLIDVIGADPSVIWLHELWRNGVILDILEGRRIAEQGAFFSENAMLGVDAGWTVIYTQLQVAYYMGITEVYLLGVDFSFAVPAARTETTDVGYETAIVSEGERNHFHPKYREPGEVWAVPRLDCQQIAFAEANKVFTRSGRRIWNASRQSKLDVFPRISLDTVLADIARH